MPMGCTVACATFETFSTFFEWVTKDRLSSPHITHYLDDFLVAGPRDMPVCVEHLWIFQALAMEVGVPLVEKKTEVPATRLTFLGIQLDTVQWSSSLLVDKLVSLKDFLGDTLEKKKCTLRQIQAILGHLSFACRVIFPHIGGHIIIFAYCKGYDRIWRYGRSFWNILMGLAFGKCR